jgi:hypothetical protein
MKQFLKDEQVSYDFDSESSFSFFENSQDKGQVHVRRAQLTVDTAQSDAEPSQESRRRKPPS